MVENFVLNIGNRYFTMAEKSYPRIAMTALKSVSKQQIDTVEKFIEAVNKIAGVSWIQNEIMCDDIIARAYISHFDLAFTRQITLNGELIPIAIGRSTYSMIR